MNQSSSETFEGLPSVDPPDRETLARETAWLQAQESLPAWRSWVSFLQKGGPGYLQSALTLGGGTAATMLFAGAAFGYRLIWVAPLSMILGVVMFSAVAHQTLSTGKRPFLAMKEHAGPVFAWAFAGGAVFSSIIWHFAQYSLGAAVLEDMGAAAGFALPRWICGGILLGSAVVWALAYGRSRKLLAWFEGSLKVLVWGIVGCFGLVVLRTGIHDPMALLAGFIPSLPESESGVSALTVVVGGLAAAVGANMLFLYPYSLLARGWGRAHRRLARFDLFAGMFLPYLLATGLMVIATANTFHYGGVEFSGKNLSPVEASKVLAGTIGPGIGRLVFNLGILGMALSSIILQMVCCGFVAMEVFGWKFGSSRYRLACLLPVPGVLGAVLWTDISLWVAVPTTLLCGFLLPLAYLGFVKLQASAAYLGSDLPRGPKARAWIGSMVLAILVLVVFLGWTLVTRGPSFLEAFL